MKRRNPLETVTVHNKPRTRAVRVLRFSRGRGAELGIQAVAPARQPRVWLRKGEARRLRDAIDAWLKREGAS